MAVFKSDLDSNRKKAENLSDLYAKVGDTQEKQKCRSAKIKMACGKSILPHQVASELDAVVKQLIKNYLNISTISSSTKRGKWRQLNKKPEKNGGASLNFIAKRRRA
ncbi:hypothetical protein [Haemophilus influenzae]|uniref:hypothetical protein n=1 Tax=Haemophilus influenzae TaxID=727 RepID=UPI002158E345